jgi:hypothetical protein
MSAENRNPLTSNKGEDTVFSKSPMFKVMLLLVFLLLVISIALGTPVLADGGGAQPYPPTQSPPQGASGGDSLMFTLLTILQVVL